MVLIVFIMKLFAIIFTALAVDAGVQAARTCPPISNDMAAVKFGYSIQNLLHSYYNSVPVNETFFSSLPNDTIPHTDFLGNFMGLQQQAQLGVKAIQRLASKAPMNSTMPMCKYNLPTPMTAKKHLMTAYQLEATLCGAFIALADYVDSPQVAFLMARLSAEHGSHATYIGSHMKSQVYSANSTSLLPAFPPQHVMESGMAVGKLGQYMNNCTAIPSLPCGGSLQIDGLSSNITGAKAT